MPLASRIVKIGKYKLLDGGVADSVPLKYFEKKGFDRIVVVLTRPDDYVKGPNKLMPLIRVVLKKYPKIVEAMEKRHEMYNETIEYIKAKEKAGEILVIRPDSDVGIKQIEKNPDELMRVYDMGREHAERQLCEIKEFLGK